MQLMSIEDLAAYLGDSKRTIYKYIASGDCPPYIRISTKNIKFDRADVDAWLESKKVITVFGGKKMSVLKIANNTKEMIKYVTQSTKLPWTPRAKSVLKSSEKRAQKDGFEFVGTEHILIGIVSVNDCLGATILKNLGTDEHKCIGLYEELCKPSSQRYAGNTKLSEDIRKIVEQAYEQATEWNHEYIGTEHLLIGILLADEGMGFQILTKLGITVEKVSEETKKLIVCRNVKNE
jgi:excisionase family DNA binding protein